MKETFTTIVFPVFAFLGISATQQVTVFEKIKPDFAHSQVHYLTNKDLGFNHENKLQLKMLDSAAAQTLFAQSKLLSQKSRPGCYAFIQKKNHYRLVFSGNGHYLPDLILMTYSPGGQLQAELTVASSFVDAGMGRITKSWMKNDSTLIVADLNLDEQPEGKLCDSTANVYRINKNGTIKLLKKKTHTLDCNYKF